MTGRELGPAIPPGAADLRDVLARAVLALGTGVTVADAARPGGPLLWVNPAFERLTGTRGQDLVRRGAGTLEALGVGAGASGRPEPDLDPHSLAVAARALAAGDEASVLLPARTRAGARWWVDLQVSPLRDPDGRLTHVLGFHVDATTRVEAERRAAHLATHDPVTGLPDRSRLADAVELALLRARSSGEGLAVLAVELDGLRDLDVEHGPAARDLLLAAVALRLRGALREDDLLGRLGAEEFLAVLPGVPAESAADVAERVAETVRATVTDPVVVPGLRLHLRAAVGVALAPDDGTDAPTLLAAARRARRPVAAAVAPRSGARSQAEEPPFGGAAGVGGRRDTEGVARRGRDQLPAAPAPDND